MSLKRFFRKTVKGVVRTIGRGAVRPFKKLSPLKLVTLIGTAGLGLAAHSVGGKRGSQLGAVANLATQYTLGKFVPIAGYALQAAEGAYQYKRAARGQVLPQRQLSPVSVRPIQQRTGAPMALNLGGILSSVGSIFGGGQNPYFQAISGAANIASSAFAPQPVAQRMPAIGGAVSVLPRSPLPMPGMMGRVGGMIGRSFFAKYPNLATAIQGFRNAGRNITRKQLWSMLKRFGPDVLISGGILSAVAISELMMAGPGHRRMNPGNVKALRRSLRRLESFHHLCQRADKFRRPARRGKVCKTGSGSQFVRQG